MKILLDPATRFGVVRGSYLVWNLRTGLQLASVSRVHVDILLTFAEQASISDAELEAGASLLAKAIRRYLKDGFLIEAHSLRIARCFSGPQGIVDFHAVTRDVGNSLPTEMYLTDTRLIKGEHGRTAGLEDEEELEGTEGVLEQSLRSRRTRYVSDQVNATLLIECLRRSVAITHVEATQSFGALGKRPYPSGGSLHPLEFYIVSRSVAGLTSSTHYFNPLDRKLYDLGARPMAMRLLLEAAAAASGLPERLPAALICVTARYGRTGQKYGALAYRLILLEAGAAMQNVMLNAGSLGLGVAPLGRLPLVLVEAAIPDIEKDEVPILEMLIGIENAECTK